MTREQFAEIVSTLLGYTDADIRVHQNDVFFTGDQMRGALISQYIDKHGHTVIGQFCKPIVYPVLFDKLLKKPYVDLGTQVLGLRMQSGILSVGLTEEDDSVFVMMQAGMTSVYAGLEAGGATGKKICIVEGNRIYFKYLEPEQTEVLVKHVPSLFALLEENEEIPQPYDFNAILVDATVQALQGQKMFPQDKLNDSRAIAPPSTQP